jgi:ribosomal protein S18 acetylase RimI-like enzyme
MQITKTSSLDIHLIIDLFNKYRMFYGQKSNLMACEAYLKDRVNKHESVIFLAFTSIEGRPNPIGFTQLYPQFSSVRLCKIWVLNDLYVEPSFRKKGIGESLIKAAINFANEDGATHVELSTAVDNFAAQSLYENIGFERQDPDNEFYNYKIVIPSMNGEVQIEWQDN